MKNSGDKNIDSQIDVKRVAELSRLSLSDEELEMTGKQLRQILDHFNSIADIDTEGVEPAYNPHDIYNQLRDDITSEGLKQEQLTGLTAHNKDGFLTVPKAVE